MRLVKAAPSATDPNFPVGTEVAGTVTDMPDEPATEPESGTAVPVEPVETGYTAGGVPTFEAVRERIETRYGTAVGASELAAETPEGREAEKLYEERQRAAAERLAQIRASMGRPDDRTDNT